MEQAPGDEPEWTGNGSDDLLKRLPDDVVEYFIYLLDTKHSDTRTREGLQAIQKALSECEKKHLKDYIWQREAMRLELARENGKTQASCIRESAMSDVF